MSVFSNFYHFFIVKIFRCLAYGLLECISVMPSHLSGKPTLGTSYLCLPVSLSLPLHLPSVPQSLAIFGLLSTSRRKACEGWIVNSASFALKHRRDSFYLEIKTNKYKYICIIYLVKITGAHSSAPGDIL